MVNLSRRVFYYFLSLLYFLSITYAAPRSKCKKLQPLSKEKLVQVVKELSSNNFQRSMFRFNIKTSKGKDIKKSTGKLFFKKNSNESSIRVEVDDKVYLMKSEGKTEVSTFPKSNLLSISTALHPNHLICFEDVSLSFLSLERYEYLRVRRVQGRDTHIIRYFREDGSAVDIAYDPVFSAILQIEYMEKLGDGFKLKKTFKLLDFKKTNDTWVMKSVEIKDHETNQTTRIDFSKVVVNCVLPEEWFQENNLLPIDDSRIIYSVL